MPLLVPAAATLVCNIVWFTIRPDQALPVTTAGALFRWCVLTASDCKWASQAASLILALRPTFLDRR
jgi:hypothetical protein